MGRLQGISFLDVAGLFCCSSRFLFLLAAFVAQTEASGQENGAANRDPLESLPEPSGLQHTEPENSGGIRRSCSNSLECVAQYEICVGGKCVDLQEGTGLQGWIVGAIAIGGILTLCTLLGCVCLHPYAACSVRYAHPRDERIRKQICEEEETAAAENHCANSGKLRLKKSLGNIFGRTLVFPLNKTAAAAAPPKGDGGGGGRSGASERTSAYVNAGCSAIEEENEMRDMSARARMDRRRSSSVSSTTTSF